MALNMGLDSGLATSRAGGTWTRTAGSSTITVTDTGHPLARSNGSVIRVTASSDTAAIPLGLYVTTGTPTANTFQFTGVNAGGTSGTLTYEFTAQTLETAAFQRANTYTYSIWYKLNQTTTLSANNRFFCTNTTSADRLLITAGSGFRLQVSFTNTAVYTFAFPSDIDTTLGRWRHFAVTYDASNTTNRPVAYHDGVVVSTTTTTAPTGTWASSNAALRIGNENVSQLDRTFNGGLAEVAYWNRILDARQIGDLALGAPPSRFMDGLLMYTPCLGNGSNRVNATPGTLTVRSGYGFNNANFVNDHPRIIRG